jgi:hypothetical protein
MIDIGLGIGVDAEHGHTSGAHGALRQKQLVQSPPANKRTHPRRDFVENEKNVS